MTCTQFTVSHIPYVENTLKYYDLTIFYHFPAGNWVKVSDGLGLNQYNPLLPHARAQAAGMPFNNGRFILNGGCSRFVVYMQFYKP